MLKSEMSMLDLKNELEDEETFDVVNVIGMCVTDRNFKVLVEDTRDI